MLNNNVNNRDELRSCCYRIDKHFALFCVSFLIVSATVSVSIYKLIVETECENATPYYSLLSSIAGIAGGSLFATRRFHDTSVSVSRNDR